MISYSRQVSICESVRERIKQALHQSDDVNLRLKANDIPTCDSILRTVSVSPNINIEDTLNDFILEHISECSSLNSNSK